ncbi:MAG: NAD(P)/FAD-dependent oxidoreductase [Bradymonadia bacterium]
MVQQAHWNVVILGAGAAGLMAAATAGARGLSVLVLERNSKVGRKILISGGGRCNFTNEQVGKENYYSENEHFARSSLKRYQPRDFIELVESHHIAYHEKTLGQLFCDHSSRQIVGMLLAECESSGVEIRCNVDVTSVADTGPFRIETEDETLVADALIVATGGLSIPKIGATDFGHRLARQFGLRMTECRPALVPLTVGGDEFEPFRQLTGTSLETVITAGKQRFREAMLFTHWGLSGPAVLQASLYWEPGEPIFVNLCPDMDASAWLLELKRSKPKTSLTAALKQVLPARLATTFMAAYCAQQRGALGEMSDKQLRRLAERLNRWAIYPTGTQGYKKAEVTRGGVATSELSSKTMAAKAHPALYFIGEVVDVTGWLGGYNFQWAWASGVAAGRSVCAST